MVTFISNFDPIRVLLYIFFKSNTILHKMIQLQHAKLLLKIFNLTIYMWANFEVGKTFLRVIWLMLMQLESKLQLGACCI